MKEKLLAYLQSHEPEILDEWHHQYIGEVVKEGMIALDAYLQPIEVFFIEVLKYCECELSGELDSATKFEHFSPSKNRVKLPHLVEVFLSGEAIIIKALTSRHHTLSPEEVEEALVLISRIFKKLIHHHVDQFCITCVDALRSAHDRLIALGQQLPVLTMAKTKGMMNE